MTQQTDLGEIVDYEATTGSYYYGNTNVNQVNQVPQLQSTSPQRRSKTSSNTSSEDLPPFPADVEIVPSHNGLQPDGYYYYLVDSTRPSISKDENFVRANEILEYYGLEPVAMMINERNRLDSGVSSMPYLTRYQSPTSSSRNTNTLPNGTTPPPYGMTPSPVSSGVSMGYDRGPLARSRSYAQDSPKSSPVPAKEEQTKSKKWSFGALFHRKSKNKEHGNKDSSTTAANNIRFIPAAELPPHLVRRSDHQANHNSNSDDENGRRRRAGPNWENTRRPVGMSTMAYSSSGSYSTDDVRGAKHRKNAVKARAVARRESFIESSSSEEDCNGSSSLQGSHSSLSSSARGRPARGRRRAEGMMMSGRAWPQGQQQGMSTMHQQQTLTPSPRWEARVVYTEETCEQEEPVVIRLPRYPRGREMAPGDRDIVREGLQVPFIVANSASSPFPADDRTYANLPLMDVDRGQFYRPVSCSYLDSRNVYSRNMMSPVPYNVVSSQVLRAEPTKVKRSPSEPPEMKVAEEKISTATSTTTSKLGYPVRKLGEVTKLPVTQSPVHMQASEFWRKKEAEVTGVEAAPKSRYRSSEMSEHTTSGSPSPLKGILRNSPKVPAVEPTSNESISSLSSSISIDGASPSSSIVNEKPVPAVRRPQSLQVIGRSSSAGQVRSHHQSACERLNVVPPSASRHAKEAFSRQVRTGTPSRATPVEPPKVNKKATDDVIKASGKDLEDALNELEDMYKSLRLSDEDLMDRAERRDLPTPHQQLRDAPPIRLSSALSSYESLDSTTPSRAGSSLAASSVFFGSDSNVNTPIHRVRAPPLRRSSRPDPEGDDMAKRRLERSSMTSTATADPRQLTGCYMLKSPAFSPPATPLPVDNAHHNALVMYSHDPDLTLDDVMFRNYKKANAIRIIDPQPMFGIPLGPTTPAPSSDYLHAQPEEKFRPLFRNTKRPDVVKDDIAFRNLRKDLNKEQNLSNKVDWTPRLFDKNAQVFSYEPKPAKKLRAIRSLSANISNLVPFKQSPVVTEIGKWNSFSDLYRQTAPRNHKEPSWVEEIERLQQRASSSETLNAPSEGAAAPLPLEGPSARALKRAEEVGKAPRRPWTDAIFEDLDKEKGGQEEEQVPEKKPTPKRRQSLKSAEVEEDQPPSFTPLPPPRKVHQIQLESFVEPKEVVAEVVVVPEVPEVAEVASEAELQLTNLIDALVRDAETCGGPEVTEGAEVVPKPIKSILKKSPEPPVVPEDLVDEESNEKSSEAYVPPVSVLPPECDASPERATPPSTVSVANDFKGEAMDLKSPRFVASESVCCSSASSTSSVESLSSSSFDEEDESCGTSSLTLSTASQPRTFFNMLFNGGIFAEWSGIFLVACYLLAFTQSLSNLEVFPAFGIVVAVLVFLASCVT